MTHPQTTLTALVLPCLIWGASPLWADEAATCALSHLEDPARVVLTCANGLVIEAESADMVNDMLGGISGAPEEIDLGQGAMLINLTPGQGLFQIRTPHAIASVRGTQYVVDVTTEQTAVFVIEGSVVVARPTGADEVAVGVGEGVRVSNDAPLEVKTWPEAVAAALLARFAR